MSLFLSILGFITILFGIFIVRAGLLKSVHSFAQDSERGFILLSVFLAYTSYGFWELSNGIKAINTTKDRISKLIFIGNWTFIACIFIISIGIFYPLISEFFRGIAVTIDANFFNITFNSLIIFSLILCILATTSWSLKSRIQLIITFITTISICLYILSKLSINYLDILAISGIVSGIYIILKSLIIYINRKENNIYMIASHCGFGLGVLAISVSSLLSSDHQQLMNIGDTTTFANFEIKLTDIQHNTKLNYMAKSAVISLKSNYAEFDLYPELRIFPIEKQMTSEPAISRHFLYDLHINMNQVTNDGYLFTFYYRPLINWLWTAVIIISITVMIRAIQDFIKLYKISKSVKKYHYNHHKNY